MRQYGTSSGLPLGLSASVTLLGAVPTELPVAPLGQARIQTQSRLAQVSVTPGALGAIRKYSGSWWKPFQFPNVIGTKPIELPADFPERVSLQTHSRFPHALGVKAAAESILRSKMQSIGLAEAFAGSEARETVNPAIFINSGLGTPAASVLVTPAAEKYAKYLGLYGSLLLAQEIVRQTFPSLKAIYVDRIDDPDEGGYATICFVVTISETVRQTLELDEKLQDALYNQIPAGHHMYLSFRYKFE